MISVIYITCRDERPFVEHPDWNQYEVLARSLGAQTYRDFECIVVTPYPESVVAIEGMPPGRLLATVPRATPWRQARTFAVASALNTGLINAHGDWCLVLGDCCEFAPDLLERIAYWRTRGVGVGVLVAGSDGKIVDMRAGWFDEHKDASGTVLLARHGGIPVPQGLIAFPLEAALAINGYDEHFDGGRGLEDVDFSTRLQQVSVPFAMDERCVVKMHPHCWSISESIIDQDSQVVRCCNATWMLARERATPVANAVNYTTEEKLRIVRCFMWNEGKCGYYGNEQDCGYPFADRGHPTAKRIMIDENLDETVLLRDERRKIGL